MQITRAMPHGNRIRQSSWLLLFSLVLFLEADLATAEVEHSNACIDAVGLCTVMNGHKHETIIPRSRFEQGQPLSTQGYVTEVKLYCVHQDISAQVVDGMPDDERLTVTHQGSQSRGSHAQVAISSKIPGDCLGVNDEVTIAVSNQRGGARDIKIRQTGYRTVYEAATDGAIRSQPLVFRYLGARSDQFDTVEGRTRFKALAEGIRKIERAYGQELVKTINIIDLKGYNNALSLKGKDEVWIYADTFWGYESGELRSMAAHETLHIFVDYAGFTEAPAVRELFADLMGFDPRSKERLTLLTTGHLPRGYSSWHKPLSPFWGFINERHFIDGMSGGHSSDNIDEFCTSFLHSLLYTERLEENLNKAIAVGPRKSPRVMRADERGHLLRLYRKAVKTFHSTADTIVWDEDRPSILDLCSLALLRVEGLFRQHT